jgi:peptidoglycan/LPS O-acetylase OafA/YrhL
MTATHIAATPVNRGGLPISPWGIEATWTVFAPIQFGGALLIAALSHYCVEKPFLKLKNRFTRERGPSV